LAIFSYFKKSTSHLPVRIFEAALWLGKGTWYTMATRNANGCIHYTPLYKDYN